VSSDSIHLDVLVAASSARVWEILTNPRHLAVWYAFDGAEIDLRPGGKLAFTWKEHGRFLGVVERVEPTRVLAFRWCSQFPEVEPVPHNSTLVEFTLMDEGDGTRVVVVESGFDSLSEDALIAMANNAEAWEVGLKTLSEYAADSERG
jgi:uncharacterized protein YndB with AHSA1/START domain